MASLKNEGGAAGGAQDGGAGGRGAVLVAEDGVEAVGGESHENRCGRRGRRPVRAADTLGEARSCQEGGMIWHSTSLKPSSLTAWKTVFAGQKGSPEQCSFLWNLISWLVLLYLQNLLQFFFEGESTPIDDNMKSIVTIIEEYFSNGDVELAARADEYHHYFVKKPVSMAMDRHDKEKEMASVLLSALYSDVISSAQIGQGFVLLLESVDNLALDILDAVDIIARAMVDDILPPAFLIRAKCTLTESSKGLQAIQTAEKSYLPAPHHAELVERHMGGSTHITVEVVKKKITDLLREYLENGDTTGTCRCIRELGVPFFDHEVVKRALTVAMETEPLILRLFKEASEESLISSSQMVKGREILLQWRQSHLFLGF